VTYITAGQYSMFLLWYDRIPGSKFGSAEAMFVPQKKIVYVLIHPVIKFYKRVLQNITAKHPS
jgi:hypothetical protein